MLIDKLYGSVSFEQETECIAFGDFSVEPDAVCEIDVDVRLQFGYLRQKRILHIVETHKTSKGENKRNKWGYIIIGNEQSQRRGIWVTLYADSCRGEYKKASRMRLWE